MTKYKSPSWKGARDRAVEIPVKRIHNPTSPCICYVEFSVNTHRIVYCPMHAAAPKLLEACEKVWTTLNDFSDDDMIRLGLIGAENCLGRIIAKARKGE